MKWRWQRGCSLLFFIVAAFFGGVISLSMMTSVVSAKKADQLTKAEAQRCVKTYDGKKWGGFQGSAYQDMHTTMSSTYRLCFDSFSPPIVATKVDSYKENLDINTIPCTPFKKNAPGNQEWDDMYIECTNAKSVLEKFNNDDINKKIKNAICEQQTGDKATSCKDDAFRLPLDIKTAQSECSKKNGDSKYQCIADELNKFNSAGYTIDVNTIKKAYGEAVSDNKKELKNTDGSSAIISEAANQTDCEIVGGLWVNGKCKPNLNASFNDITDKDRNDYKTCKIGTWLDWLICPTTIFLGSVSDGFYNIIDGLLEVNSSMFNTDSAAYRVFSVFLPIANILLAIAFTVIIYSEATGNAFGSMSNYSVKKLLPRLIVFAIIVNLSWWLCAVAVDISNILGANLKDFFGGVGIDALNKSAPSWTNAAANVNGGYRITTVNIVAGATMVTLSAIGGAAMFGQLATLGILFLAVILVLAMTYLILIVRQAGVILLCILAPAAIAMAILPNTRKLFDKWKQWMLAMLITYPIISLIYGASDLASKVLATAAGNGDWTLALASQACRVIPLIAAPFAILACLNGVGVMGAALGGFAAGRISSQLGRAGRARKQGYEKSWAHRRVVQGQSAVAGAVVHNRVLGRFAGANTRDAAARYANMEKGRFDEGVKLAGEGLKANYTAAERREIAITGTLNGQKFDTYQRAAALRDQKDNMTGAEYDQMMEGVASETASMKPSQVKSTGMDRLSSEVASAAIDSKKASMSAADINRMMAGSMTKGTKDNKTLDYSQVADARNQFLSSRTEDDLHGTTGEDVRGWQQSLARAYANSGHTADDAKRAFDDDLRTVAESYKGRLAAGATTRVADDVQVVIDNIK